MNKTLTILTFVLLWVAIACRHSAEFPTQFKGEELRFGQGGGFSGFVTQFSLLEDGRLYQKIQRDTSYTFVKKWPRAFVKQMFHNYNQLNLDQQDFNEPGDLYYFIEYHSPKDMTHRLTWGKPGFKPDENVVLFYNLLYRSTKTES